MIEEVEYNSERVNFRSLRVLELLLVVFVAFGAPMLSAAYIWLRGARDITDSNCATLASLSGIVYELAALAGVEAGQAALPHSELRRPA